MLASKGASVLAVAVAGWLVTGCGIVDLWERSVPLDSGAIELRQFCLDGISAFCSCREQTKPRGCADAEIDRWLARCEKRAEGWLDFVGCTAAEVEGELVDCDGVFACGVVPE